MSPCENNRAYFRDINSSILTQIYKNKNKNNFLSEINNFSRKNINF